MTILLVEQEVITLPEPEFNQVVNGFVLLNLWFSV